MEPASRIAQHHVDIVGLGVLDGIVDHRRGVATLLVGDDLAVEVVGMLLKLFVRAGAVGVAVGQHRTVATIGQILRELGDRGRLADAVDAGEDDGDRFVGRGDPLVEVELPDTDHVKKGVVERALDEFTGRLDLLARLADHRVLDGIEDFFGDAHLHIALQQGHFELPQWVFEVIFLDDDLAGGKGSRAFQRARPDDDDSSLFAIGIIGIGIGSRIDSVNCVGSAGFGIVRIGGIDALRTCTFVVDSVGTHG